MGAKWSDLGIPEGFAWPKLLVSTEHQKIALRMRRSDGRNHHAWWIRDFASEKYMHLCGAPASDVDFSSGAFDAEEPLLYLNVMHYSPTKDVNGKTIHGYDWHGLECHDLVSLKRRSTLRVINGWEDFSRIWISDVLATANEPKHLICKIAYQGHDLGAGSKVEYFLCDMNVQTGACVKLANLPGTFI